MAEISPNHNDQWAPPVINLRDSVVMIYVFQLLAVMEGRSEVGGGEKTDNTVNNQMSTKYKAK